MEWEQLDAAAPILPRKPVPFIPPTPTQHRIWNHSVDASGARRSLRLCASAVRILGSFDPIIFERSIDATVRRHEALRTQFVLIDGVPYQHVADAGAYALKIVELSRLSAPAAYQEALRQAQEFIDSPIDLRLGPVFEARAWKLRDHDYVLVVLIDHMISDGMSNAILMREIWDFYNHAIRGEQLDLPALPIQFGDYSMWQEQTRASWMRAHECYWREHLSGVQPTMLPLNQFSSTQTPPMGLTAHVPFGIELTARLRKAAQRERTLLSVFVFAAYAIVVSGWCRREDILIAFPVHGRNHPSLRNVVGFVANIMHLRLSVVGSETLRDLLSRARDEVSSAFQHRDFDRVPDFVPECITEVVFNWQATHSRIGPLEHHVVLECAAALERRGASHSDPTDRHKPQIVPLPARTPSQLKFSPVIFDTPESLHMAVAYRPDLFTSNSVQQFARKVMFVADKLAQSASATISSVLTELQHRNPEAIEAGLPEGSLQ